MVTESNKKMDNLKPKHLSFFKSSCRVPPPQKYFYPIP